MLLSITFLPKKNKSQEKLTLVKAYNFQIHCFMEKYALNLSEYFLVLIIFPKIMKKH